jgi:hypothetical protein
LGVSEVELKRPPLGLGIFEVELNRPPLGLGVSDLFPKSPPLEEPNLDGCPKLDVAGAGDVAKPNFDGAGVVVGVVDSGLCCAGNKESFFARGVSSVSPAEPMSSSLGVGVVTAGLLLASVRADPKLLPNKEPVGLALLSLAADPSGLNELWSLKGVDPNGLLEDSCGLAGNAVSVVEGDPKAPPAGLFPLPNTLPLPSLFTEAKPLLPANPANPPDAGAPDDVLVAAFPKGLVLLLLAKLENPDWPKAGADPGATPPDADPAAQGELFAPS